MQSYYILSFFSNDETDNTSITCIPGAIHLILCCLLVVFSHIHFTNWRRKKDVLKRKEAKAKAKEKGIMCVNIFGCLIT